MKTLPYLALILLFLACQTDYSKKKSGPALVVKSPVTLSLEYEGNKPVAGQVIKAIATASDEAKSIDKVDFYHGEELLESVTSAPFEISIPTSDWGTGRNEIRAMAVMDGKIERKSEFITLLSDITPKIYGFRVINAYPHDRRSYTQGLIYVDGAMYEGTGHKGLSALKEVDIETGKTIREQKMDSKIFGEGITVMGDKVYQLSWQAATGFVYRLEDFEPIGHFYYQGEGWGLTHNGEQLIMSNGSHRISFHDPETYEELRHIEVYDDQNSVGYLNELEYIDGKIYANVWQKDDIVIIDPASGKVEGRIRLKGLLTKPDRDGSTDVLNGIAYNPETGRLFVTGKFWSKLFEIEVVDPGA